jgi:y4mF family transcriptional regulator
MLKIYHLWYDLSIFLYICSIKGINMQENLTDLSKHIKLKRKQNKLTQPELAMKAGVGLRFVRDLEQGKTTLRIDKVNDVLRLFGETLGPIPLEREKLLQQNE